MPDLYAPSVHYFMTLIHIVCAMFWLGWMTFFSLIMVPVLRREVPDEFGRLRAHLQSRTRRVVNVMLVLLVLTGNYNMAYRGLFDLQLLLYTEYGLRFVLKLCLAVLLIGMYLLAPRFDRQEDPGGGKKAAYDSPAARRIFLGVHVVILTMGLTIAYLGIGVGG